MMVTHHSLSIDVPSLQGENPNPLVFPSVGRVRLHVGNTCIQGPFSKNLPNMLANGTFKYEPKHLFVKLLSTKIRRKKHNVV